MNGEAKDRWIVDELGYSIRRQHIDDFFFQHIPALPVNSLILDLGGHKTAKRGRFDIAAYQQRVVNLNLTTAKQPDVQADAARIPFAANTFDALICAELLEHVPDPRPVLHEIQRVLKPECSLFITVPFLIPIHGDPYDYARYTSTFWRENLSAANFTDITIRKQGVFWSVLVDMLRHLAYYRAARLKPRSRIIRRLMVWFINRARRWAEKRESLSTYADDPFYGNYTTGFGITCKKARS